jgi:hypothetical protein
LRLRPRWLAHCLPLQWAGLLHGTIDISGGLVHSIKLSSRAGKTSKLDVLE